MNEQVNIPETGRFNGMSLPTKWNGITFRSRLEARWAIFFDSLNPRLPYEYEPELLETPSGWYLPDFYLPSVRTFWIVKGDRIPDDELEKVFWIGERGFGICIHEGQIPMGLDGEYSKQWCAHGGYVFHSYDQSANWDNSAIFCQCHKCGKYGVEFDGRTDRICRHDKGDKGYGDTQNIRKALDLARNHRFDNRD